MPEIKLNEDQLSAVRSALSNKVSIINGGAGCGKTTVIKSIVEEIGIKNVALVCPTGKAAHRLREASGYPTSTIHRLLMFNGAKFMASSLSKKSVIVDESSMVDSKLMAQICSRNPDRLVLVGDEAQLEPVDVGAPFHSLVKLKPDIVSTLSICYRSSEAIYNAADCIRRGNLPKPKDVTDGEHFEIIGTESSAEAQERVLDMYRNGDIDFSKDIILCARNGKQKGVLKTSEEQDPDTEHGTVHSVNSSIIDIMSNRKSGEKWVNEDRIICLKNNPSIDTWNGTTGTVVDVENDKRNGLSLWVRGDIPFYDSIKDSYEDVIKWPSHVVNDCQHAYALTMHKSQGSQYRKVFLISRRSDLYAMLTRPLLYTGVTRAMKACYVVGDHRSFLRGIGRVNPKNCAISVIADGDTVV